MFPFSGKNPIAPPSRLSVNAAQKREHWKVREIGLHSRPCQRGQRVVNAEAPERFALPKQALGHRAL